MRASQGEESGTDAARRVVSDFLEARVDGTGAEEFLTRDAKAEFNREWAKTHLGLHPLYAVPGTSYESFRLVFVERLHEDSYEVGYRMNGSPRFAETLFVIRQDSVLKIGGGRLGLSGP